MSRRMRTKLGLDRDGCKKVSDLMNPKETGRVCVTPSYLAERMVWNLGIGVSKQTKWSIRLKTPSGEERSANFLSEEDVYEYFEKGYFPFSGRFK